MRIKLNKPLMGAIGLIAVVIMTIIAAFIPTPNASAEETGASVGSMSDTLKIMVYNQFPSITLGLGLSNDATVSPEVSFDFLYEHIDYIDFTLSYEDEDGNVIEIPLPRYVPSDLDSSFTIGSGTDKITIDLSDFDLEYGTYVISAHAHSPIGFDEDSYEFYYVPAKATQLEKDEDDDAADPVINVEYDDTVEKIEIVVYDGSGNPVFDEPLVINVPAPYRAGAEEITLPFGSYGLPSGDDYKIKLIAFFISLPFPP